MNEELKVIITAELDRYKAALNQAKQQVNDFKSKVAEASKDVDAKFKALGTGIANGMKVAAAGIAAALGALVGISAATEEYRASQAKLTTAFEAAGAGAEEAKATYNDLFRVLGDSGQATEAAAHLAKLTTEEKALSEWTNICQGVYATFGDSLPIEGLTEAANETAKVGTVTGSLADALNWAGVSEDAFNEKLAACNTEAEREKLIRETLNGLYSEAADKYEKNNAQVLAQNEAQAKLTETLARVGEAVAPVITLFTNFANEALAAVAPYIEQLAADYMPALEKVLGTTAEILGEVVGYIANNVGVLATIAGIIAGISAAIGLYNAVAAVKAAMDAAQVTTLGALASAYAAQAAAMIVAIAPYVLIVAAIAAVIAAIVLCIKHWDKIAAATKKVWQNIQKATKEAVADVVKKYEELKDKATKKIEELKTAATNKFNELKTGAVNKAQELKQSVVNKYQELKTGITSKINEAKSAVTSGFSNIVTTAKNKAQEVLNAVGDKFNGIKGKVQTALSNAKAAVDEGIAKIKKAFDFEWKLPKPKIPTFSITGGEAPYGLGGKGSLPRININWNALGGVFDTPTVFAYGGSLQGLGENGAEAIVPLEKNTQWLNRIADMLGERMGGNTPIVLEVDGKVFAQTAINTINANTRQQGRLALNII
jgi:hypothetical protein